MVTSHHSSVLDHPIDTVWSLIRDFNNYPVYIEGVSESVIEDDRRGDEVGAVRRFCYAGHWIRQRLAAHSDDQHSLSYAGVEPFPFPGEKPHVPPAHYQGTIALRPVTDSARSFIEWSVSVDAQPQHADVWRELLSPMIAEWTNSLRRTLDRDPLQGG